MAPLLAAALVGDLVFLPALLVSPLGRFFSPTKKKKQVNTSSSPVEEEVQEDLGDGPKLHLKPGQLQRHDPSHRQKPG